MKTFTTKYDIGEEVYFVSKIGLMNDYYKVEKGEIRKINFGGKNFKKYEIGNYHYSEQDLFKNAEEARKKAEEKAKKHYEDNLKTIKEERIPDLIN